MIGQFFGIFLGEQQNILQKIYKKKYLYKCHSSEIRGLCPTLNALEKCFKIRQSLKHFSRAMDITHKSVNLQNIITL